MQQNNAPESREEKVAAAIDFIKSSQGGVIVIASPADAPVGMTATLAFDYHAQEMLTDLLLSAEMLARTLVNQDGLQRSVLGAVKAFTSESSKTEGKQVLSINFH